MGKVLLIILKVDKVKIQYFFFFSVQVDQENRMANFFWRDGRSKLDYDCFGDVFDFDTTY